MTQILQEQDSFILNSAKLDFYKNLYDFKACANCVDLISCRAERSILAKIHLSVHNLAVEKGKHNNISRPNRICPVCSTVSVENEDRFLLKCTAYRQLREDFVLKINRLGINISIANCASNAINWYHFLNCKNVTAMKLLVKFIRSLSETRESLL